MERYFRALIKKPGQAAEVTMIGSHLENFRNIVGGRVEGVPLPYRLQVKGIYAYCNDDGKNLGLEENFRTDFDIIVGNVVFFSVDGENEASLNDSQIEAICDWLGCDYQEV